MAELRIGQDAVLSDDLSGFVRQAIERATGGVFSVLEEETDRVFREAVDEWPVKSGRSKRDLYSSVEIGPDAVHAHLGNRNTGGYVYYISSRHTGPAYQNLIRHPMLEVADKAAERFGDVVTDEMRRVP